jgi:hypothetical protein
MNQEDTNTMLAEILEKFIIYLYDKYTPKEFNCLYVLNSFIECDDDDTKKLFIFNLFKNSGYFNEIQYFIYQQYFTCYFEKLKLKEFR